MQHGIHVYTLCIRSLSTYPDIDQLWSGMMCFIQPCLEDLRSLLESLIVINVRLTTTLVRPLLELL